MVDDDEVHKREVKASVERALAAGLDSPDKIWRELMGADPRLASEILQQIRMDTAIKANFEKTIQQEAAARRCAANLPLLLPAPDPVRSQWWFTLETVVWLSNRTQELAGGGAVAFLGAPTAGHHYSFRYGGPVTILDVDQDVIESIKLPDGCIGDIYDVSKDLPEKHKRRHSIAVIDPPWYPAITRLFISRARELLSDSGFILCVLPSRLTRPGLIQERTALLNDLLEANYEIVSLESQVVKYRVPSFEAKVYQDLTEFTGRPWRQGDLLILRVGLDSSVLKVHTETTPSIIEAFARKPTEFRVFLRSVQGKNELDQWIVPISEFDKTVSTRDVSHETIDIWTTNKKAGQVKNASVARMVLNSWMEGKTFEETVIALSKENVLGNEAKAVMDQFKNILDLWAEGDQPSRRRKPSDLRRGLSHLLSDLASTPSKRIYDYHEDEFRLGFQRDRDRILWSHGLKKLANKSQVFTVDRDYHLRTRLSHSVEVMQLAATIARAFGLDPDLTEAGALAHDMGHAPFGHAGEHALNSVLNEINPKLGGFNHYEHGVDVVRWLEDAYQSPGIGGVPGLNLTPETYECIFKHMFHRKGHKLGQQEILQKSKHKDLQDVFCHLEGQAVRIADKISYLISDLEDGIRMGVFTLDHLLSCRLFDHPPIDLYPAKEEYLFERFISQRRALLRVLMEDVLVETDRRLAHLHSIAAVRKSLDYTVNFSSEIQAEVREVWKLLQKGILHKDSRVIRANHHTAKIVSELFLLYSLSPALIEDRFVRIHNKLQGTEYMRHYEGIVKEKSVGIPGRLVISMYLERMIGRDLKSKEGNWIVPLQDIIRAKDYVVSLTDTQANLAHRDLLRGSNIP